MFCFSQVVQKQMLSEVENWTASCVMNVYIQKLLKLDNPSSGYGKKLVCFYASQCIYAVLPVTVTRHGWTCPASARQTGLVGTPFVYPSGVEGFVDLGVTNISRYGLPAIDSHPFAY